VTVGFVRYPVPPSTISKPITSPLLDIIAFAEAPVPPPPVILTLGGLASFGLLSHPPPPFPPPEKALVLIALPKSGVSKSKDPSPYQKLHPSPAEQSASSSQVKKAMSYE